MFADLGLMIIDEEQRFGVKHKKALKELKKQVHVPDLDSNANSSYLHMSMLGIRDLSVIETPPTQSLSCSNLCFGKRMIGVIRDAVLREMDRGGPSLLSLQ